MGRRGPQPKNPAMLQRRNAEPMRVLDGGRMDKPPLPSNVRWLKVTMDGWDAYWDSELSASMRPKDVPALIRLFEMRNQHERMTRIVNKDPLIPGSQGQPVLNPAARLMTQLMAEIRQMEREFGLTPDAGSRLMGTAAKAQRSVADLVAGGDDPLQVIDMGG